MAGQFGPFVLERMLGRGGMAEAFLARRLDSPEPLVLKRIRPDYAHDQAYLRRLVLEAQVASRLAHDNLVRFQEFGRVGDCHYIVMDQVRGHSLHRILEQTFERKLPFPLRAALSLGLGLLDGLSAMHAVRDENGPRPMLHRDVTPANVIVRVDGQPVLIDFGIAKDVNGPAITLPGQVVGTGRYMAPEHRRAEHVDPRADVFSVSVVMFELLTSAHPWPPLPGIKELLRTSFDRPAFPADAESRLPAPIREVILRGLECAAEDRWVDAGAMRAALLEAAGDLDLEAGSRELRSFLRRLELPLDEAITQPVVDTLPPEGDDREIMWSADGAVHRAPLAPASPPRLNEASVLTVPPLPPRRDAEVSFEAAHRAALGPRLPLAPAAAALAALGVGAAWWLHIF